MKRGTESRKCFAQNHTAGSEGAEPLNQVFQLKAMHLLLCCAWYDLQRVFPAFLVTALAEPSQCAPYHPGGASCSPSTLQLLEWCSHSGISFRPLLPEEVSAHLRTREKHHLLCEIVPEPLFFIGKSPVLGNSICLLSRLAVLDAVSILREGLVLFASVLLGPTLVSRAE